jgi:hypothetical protein
MDCIRTQATLSALHDHEPVTEESAEAARIHGAGCGPCRTFASNLGVLDALPGPKAPPELVDRIMVAVAAIAAERAREAPSVGAEEVEPASPGLSEQQPPRLEWFRGNLRWGTFGAIGVAALALVLFVVIGTGRPPTDTTSDRATVTTGQGAASLVTPEVATGAAPAAPAPTPAPVRAPDYLTFKSRVYTPGSLLADSTGATQSVGTVSTAFGGAGAPTQVTAYRSPIVDGSIVVNGPDGSRLYEPVTRMFTSVKYQLVAGNAVERFGVWPQLPTQFAAPASPGGSPTFTAAGGDGLGVQTYTAKGVPQTQGFAIAPGTPASDPAASNPNWTWWEPMPTP